MSNFRVVMARALPFAESNRVQREAWRRGYSTRLAGRDAAHPGYQVVEFLRMVEELPAPDRVSGFADDLNLFLTQRDVTVVLPNGRDPLWVESIQPKIPHTA